jgi:hypothetical protein
MPLDLSPEAAVRRGGADPAAARPIPGGYVATELSSGAITSILEAVPGIATVLRSPIADAIVNLSRAAAGLIPFDTKDAHEMLRYAVRRGLIRSDEGDRVAVEINGAAKLLKSVARAAARAAKHPVKKPAKKGKPAPKKAGAKKK